MSDTRQKHLRVVGEPPEPSPAAMGQLQLPFVQDTFVIILADVTNAPEQEFLRLLESVRPDAVVDLRVVPRFDFGRLSRKAVFRIFEEIPAQYYDLPYSIGVTDRHHALLNPVFVAEPLTKLLARTPQAQRVIMLLDDAAALDSSLRVLPDQLRSQPRGGWQVRNFADL